MYVDGRLEYEHVNRIGDSQYQNMMFWYMRDVDAGEVNEDLDQAVDSYQLLQKLRGDDGQPSSMYLAENMYRYSPYTDLLDPLDELKDRLPKDNDKGEVVGIFNELLSVTPDIGRLFPGKMARHAEEAYGETVTSALYALVAIQRGDELPTAVQLRGGGQIELQVGNYSDSLKTLKSLSRSLQHLVYTTSREAHLVNRVNETGSFGMYRIGTEGTVISTVRLRPATSYDPAIEFADRNGTQASIGYTVEEDEGFVSCYKDEQRSPFCIRIDNEGDKVSLDIGSILGRKGTLGKRVADLITTGDLYRSEKLNRVSSLNHNSRKFAYSGLEDSEEFARQAAELAEAFENRWQANRGRASGRLALQAERSAA